MKLKLFDSNVWADVFGNPVPPRDTLLADIITERMPDVLSFQEMHPNWHKSELKPRLFDKGYRESRPDLGECTLNYTPVFYNDDRFNEIRSAFHLYTGPNDCSSKSYSLTVLEEKSSGIRIGALATHFWFMWDEAGQAARIQNARELVEGIDGLDDCAAVFCGGDFNCNVHDAPFGVLREHGIVSASECAVEKVNCICSWHRDPVYDKERGEYVAADVSTEANDRSLDHIVFRGARIERYEVVTDERARKVSDHCPIEIIAEVK